LIALLTIAKNAGRVSGCIFFSLSALGLSFFVPIAFSLPLWRNTMDSETKQILKDLCTVIRASTEQAYHALELAEKVHLACSHQVAGFQNCFDNPVPLDVGHILDSRAETLKLLDAVIAELE
jgi:hypothetical protein